MIIITTYKDLKFLINAFKKGYFDLLILVSNGGLGKTYNAHKILKKTAHRINCHVTPLGLYEQGYTYKKKSLWFDDVENMFNNDKLIGLLKQFCETQPEKEIQYMTSWNLKKTRKLPKEYTTTSKILMTCNSIQRISNKGVAALMDRGIAVHFKPSKEEVIAYIKKSFKKIDKQVIEFLKKSNEFSLRDYIKSCQLKDAGFKNWRELIKIK